MLGAAGGRWAVAAALAAFCAIDAAQQYCAAATRLLEQLHLSDAQLRFLEVAPRTSPRLGSRGGPATHCGGLHF